MKTILLPLLLLPALATAGARNPFLQPPPPIAVQPGPASGGPGTPPPGTPVTAGMPPPVIQPPANTASGSWPGSFTNPVYPPEKWLAEASVTAIVGDRASLLVPTSLNAAQAANAPSGAPGGFTQLPAQPAAAQTPSAPGSSGASTGSGAASPPVARQYGRVDILYVRHQRPLIFRGERFDVEITGNEVAIYRPAKRGRDIVFFAAGVTPTEYALPPVVGNYTTPDATVSKQITPALGNLNAATGGASSATSNGGAR